MIRQLIFISVFAATAAMAALAQNVTGTVTCGGAGVSGVAVSDGINVVTTDKQGRYALQTDKANGYVFISFLVATRWIWQMGSTLSFGKS